MDYGTPVTSDEEWEAKEDGMVTDSKEDVAVADFENMEAPSSPPARESLPSQSPSPASSEKESTTMSLEKMSAHQLKEEAAVRIIAFSEHRAEPSLSAGSSQLAVQLVE